MLSKISGNKLALMHTISAPKYPFHALTHTDSKVPNGINCHIHTNKFKILETVDTGYRDSGHGAHIA